MKSAKTADINITPQLLDLKQAAIFLNRSPWTVAEMVRSGRLPFVPDGKRKFIAVEDLHNWIRKNRRIMADSGEIPYQGIDLNKV
jgi:excisionase family DNA binding protein